MKPIPEDLQTEFVAYVEMADDPEAPDGAWQARIEDACRAFLKRYKLSGFANDAFHQYLHLRYPDDT